MGDDAYVYDFLLQKERELCGDPESGDVGTIARVTAALAERSAHCAHTAIFYSLQSRVDYVLSAHLPSQTRRLAAAVDKARGAGRCGGPASYVPQDVAQDVLQKGAPSSLRHHCHRRRLCAARAEMGAHLGSSAAFGSGCGQAAPGVPRTAPLCLYEARLEEVWVLHLEKKAVLASEV